MADEQRPDSPAEPPPPPPPTGAGNAGAGDEVTERLRMLDHLYATGTITAAELNEARARALAEATSGGGSTPPPPAAASGAIPPAPPPAAAPTTASPGSSGGRKMPGGLPPWAIGAIGAFAVVGLIVIGIALLGGDDEPDPPAAPTTVAQVTTADDPAPTPPATTDPTSTTLGTPDTTAQPAAPSGPAYADTVRAPMRQLTSSAVATGTTLARTSEPADIRRVNRMAESQITLVETARRRLAETSVSADDARAHRALISAVATHRRYLVLLGRASSGTMTAASVANTNRARREGGATLAAYRSFFRLAPDVPDAITSTDLTDTAGLRSAQRKAIAAAAAPPPAPSAPAAPAPSAPSVYGSSTFQSPTGNLRCQNQGSQLFCSSSNDGFGVFLPSSGGATTGRGTAPGGPTLPYGSTWSQGAFRCSSSVNGFTCYNSSGNGFFLNRDTYRDL